jgi:glutathione peroxidase
MVAEKSVYDFTIPNSIGEQKSLIEYKGKVILIVNTASQCGFTPQYEGLQNLHNQYYDKGLIILAVPCNQFGAQEPGSNVKIQEFCQLNYGLSFPVMGKVDVNGTRQHPLFTFLTKEAKGIITDSIKWNFTKFLIDREGMVVERFAPVKKPESIASHIERLL